MWLSTRDFCFNYPNPQDRSFNRMGGVTPQVVGRIHFREDVDGPFT